MTTQLHNKGEEFERKVLSGETTLPTSVDVLLFHDGETSGNTTAGDDLVAADDIAAITTEPDGNYARKTISLDGSTSWTLQQDANSDYELQHSGTLTFDLSTSTTPTTIDAYAVVVNWDDGSGAADHLWWTDTIEDQNGTPTAYDVGSVDSFDLSETALAVSGQNAP